MLKEVNLLECISNQIIILLLIVLRGLKASISFVCFLYWLFFICLYRFYLLLLIIE